ncbi:MAG: hypothetical protein QNJ98_14395 [Planctomycetota bacterium]|nr:hypothetical protein [Planctomycetota bacterium]
MRVPVLPCISLCILTLALAGCGGGGSGPAVESGNAAPVIWTVTNLNDAGDGSLRDAVANAPDGAWIVFDPTLATGTIVLASHLEIDRPIVIGGLSGTLDRHTISGNDATRLFMVVSGGSLDLRDMVLTAGNAQPGGGGAIHAHDANLALRRVTIAACHSSSSGGAITIIDGELDMTDSAITACTADWGGAISAGGTLGRIERCSFYLNTVSGSVGGALHLGRGDFTIVNSTLSHNTVLYPNGRGGAIALLSHGSGAATLRLWASTITDNTADNGGGIHAIVQDGQPAHLISSYSIVAGNTAGTGPDLLFVDGATADGGGNVIGIGDGSFFWDGIGNNQVGDGFTPLDPQLEPPAFALFGRVMRTPSPASPAVDAIPAGQFVFLGQGPLDVDKRGLPRVVNGAADAGAIERQ